MQHVYDGGQTVWAAALMSSVCRSPWLCGWGGPDGQMGSSYSHFCSSVPFHITQVKMQISAATPMKNTFPGEVMQRVLLSESLPECYYTLIWALASLSFRIHSFSHPMGWRAQARHKNAELCFVLVLLVFPLHVFWPSSFLLGVLLWDCLFKLNA